MADYPQTPLPSEISVPEFIDSIHRMTSDSGIELRRVKHSRPRRRWVLSYFGKSANDMHLIRDFLAVQRFGALPFTWYHSTALDNLTFFATTPITISFNGAHGLITGQMLGIFQSPGGNAKNGFYTITRVNNTQVSLNGSTSGGSGVGAARVYVPNAVGVFADDTWASPVTLRGPEVLTPIGGQTPPAYSFTVTIEELL